MQTFIIKIIKKEIESFKSLYCFLFTVISIYKLQRYYKNQIKSHRKKIAKIS
jgi:hypothetical protein